MPAPRHSGLKQNTPTFGGVRVQGDGRACGRRGPAGVNKVTDGLYLNRSLDYDTFDAVREYLELDQA